MKPKREDTHTHTYITNKHSLHDGKHKECASLFDIFVCGIFYIRADENPIGPVRFFLRWAIKHLTSLWLPIWLEFCTTDGQPNSLIYRLRGFFFVFILLVGASNAQHEDCERPPSIAHGSGRLLVDDNEDVVKAIYNCAPGYELEGKATLNCDLDNDEWQGEPPKCVAGKDELCSFMKARTKNRWIFFYAGKQYRK
jgi:Sushi repeat (SCR repeat)